MVGLSLSEWRQGRIGEGARWEDGSRDEGGDRTAGEDREEIDRYV